MNTLSSRDGSFLFIFYLLPPTLLSYYPLPIALIHSSMIFCLPQSSSPPKRPLYNKKCVCVCVCVCVYIYVCVMLYKSKTWAVKNGQVIDNADKRISK